MDSKFLKNKELIKQSLIIVIPILSLLISYASSKTDYFEFLEYKTFDLRLEVANEDKKGHEDIVIVQIDEASLETLEPVVGRWPWPRQIWSSLIEYFQDAGAKSVVFDLLFSQYSEGASLSDDDMMLTDATSKFKVYHSALLKNEKQDEYNKTQLNQNLPEQFIKMHSIGDSAGMKSDYNYYNLPFTELWKKSHGIGFVDAKPDNDGVYRHIDLIRSYKNELYPMLSIVPIIKNYTNVNIDKNKLYLDDIKIPFENNQYTVPILKKFNSNSVSGIFASIQKIAMGEEDKVIVNKDDFKDKHIFIGASAIGIEDIKQSSIGTLPGVYFHASTLSSILNKEFIKKTPNGLNIMITFILCIIICWPILFSEDFLLKNAPFFIFLGGIISLSIILMSKYYIWLPLVLPINAISFTYVFTYIYRTFYERKDKEFLKKAFGNYVSPKLIDIMHERGEFPTLGGVSGVRTALFTDVEKFSAFSEALSADELVKLINEYLSAMTDILLEEDGTLDKYIGDAIVAFFGAPLPQEDHAKRAARVAIKMQKKLIELRAKWQSEGERWPEIVHNMNMRIGINTGRMVTGNVGSIGRMDYTMMGDSVNLAARLESACKQYGIYILISEESKNDIGDTFLTRKIDKIAVVGKTKPVTVYELIDTKEEASKDVIELFEKFNQAMDAFYNLDFTQAKTLFEQTLKLEDKRGFPNSQTTPSQIFIDRCDKYIATPPASNWDGVNRLTSK